MIRRVQFLIAILLSGGVSATAQNQYLSVFDYHTMAVSPIDNIPGVSWISNDNTTYDANHQRFFFQGGPTQLPPWKLFTIDATTGAVLFSPQVPANHSAGSISGLQYDNSVDTLYALYDDGAGNYSLSWVDISTGNIHPKQVIPGFPGYAFSAYDIRDHLYICYGGQKLLTIDARTGNQIYSGAFPLTTSVFDLMYDNANSTLYGISVSGGVATFDSIGLATAAIYPLTILTVQSFPQVNAYTLDEGKIGVCGLPCSSPGNYIFAGTLPSVASCVNYRLYTIDLKSATIVDSSLFPYAQDPSNPLDSNLIEFSFDNRRGTLYAMNWRPTLQTIAPVITISGAADSTCPGQSDAFTATLSAAQAVNNYQWLLNDQPVGANTPNYTDANPINGDSVRCVLTATTVCGSTFVDTSGPVVLTVSNVPVSSLRITSSVNNICAGDTAVFQAMATGEGKSPQFQWLINGIPSGPDNATFNYPALAAVDTITCVMRTNLTCSLPDTSQNVLVVTVKPEPALTMPPDAVISRGQEVQLSPSVSGGTATYQWQPSAGLSDPSVPDPVASPLKTTVYQLSVTDSDGCGTSGEVTVRVSTPLVMPGAFTPNGDGRNDVFRIPPSLSIQLSRFSIYNRWGQQVFGTADPDEGWEGTAGGRLAPAGAYVWVVEYIDPFTGKQVVQMGTVMLIR